MIQLSLHASKLSLFSNMLEIKIILRWQGAPSIETYRLMDYNEDMHIPIGKNCQDLSPPSGLYFSLILASFSTDINLCERPTRNEPPV